MKINTSYWKDDSDDKKSSRADWVAQAKRHAVRNEESAATKQRQTESPVKEETKFSGILESAAKSQKLGQTKDEAGERREDEKKDRKNAARDKDSADNAAVADRIERGGSSYGGNFGGGSNFGGDINQTVHLSENFAARSILHIADLERMISAVRKLNRLDGKREITLELKRSVMDGLKVKITSGDASQVSIEFLAANESVRSQIEDHSEELANILRGRGVNLRLMSVTIDDSQPENSNNFAAEVNHISQLNPKLHLAEAENSARETLFTLKKNEKENQRKKLSK